MPGNELIGNEELDEISYIFKNGSVLYRYGFDNKRNNCFKVREFESQFSRYFSMKYALGVTSGTAALRVALAALGIKEGDEVITQSFTFVATVEAIIESKATPICTEIDNTLNMDPIDLEKKITSNTKAVIVVHMLGTPANLEQIKEICSRKKIYLIEDTAWGCGGSLQNKKLGTWGDISTFSFDFAKTMTTGEGGMLLIKNKDVYKRASAWHDHGHENNPNFARWEDTRSSSGFNFRMNELQGAVGLAQLRKLDKIVNLQRSNSSYIWGKLKTIKNIQLRNAPKGSYETCDALIFLVPNKITAHRCREEIINQGLTTKILPEAYTWHFAGTWNHMSELVRASNNDLKNAFPKSQSLLERAVAIPINVEMEEGYALKLYNAVNKALHFNES